MARFQYGKDWRTWDNPDGLRWYFPYRTAYPFSRDKEWSGTLARKQKDLTAAATTVLDWDAYNFFNVSLGTDTTISILNPRTNSDFVVLFTKDASASSRSITWPANVEWVGGKINELTTSDQKKLIYISYYGGTYRASEQRSYLDYNVITPQAFGAVGDGVTDDSQAISDAIAAADEGLTSLYIPPGSYLLDSLVTVDLANPYDFALFGDGRVSRFIISNPTGGLLINAQRKTQVYVHDLAIESAETSGTGYGLWVAGTSSGSSSKHTAIVRNINFCPMEPASNLAYFSNAPLLVTNMKRPIIEGNICGLGDGVTGKALSQIDVTDSFGPRVRFNWFNMLADVGLRGQMNTTNEGFFIFKNHFVGADVGLMYEQGTVKLITGATQANPCVITSASHGLETGDVPYIRHVLGMTNLNGTTPTITKINNNSFSLNGVDSTGYPAYTGGGTISYGGRREPNGSITDNHINSIHKNIHIDGLNSVHIANNVLYPNRDNLTFTYSQSGTTVTVTCSSKHFFSASDTFTTSGNTGGLADGTYTVSGTGLTSSQFQFTAGDSATRSGILDVSVFNSEFIDIDLLNVDSVTIENNTYNQSEVTKRTHVRANTASGMNSSGYTGSLDSTPILRELIIRNDNLRAYSGASSYAYDISSAATDIHISYKPLAGAYASNYVNRIVNVSFSSTNVNVSKTEPVTTNVSNNNNTSTTETDLASVTINGELYKAGAGFIYEAWGQTANNANAKTIRVKFGTSTVGTASLSTGVAGLFRIEGTIVARNAANQKYVTKAFEQTNSLTPEYGQIAETVTGALTFKVTGQGGASNDITLQGLIVRAI